MPGIVSIVSPAPSSALTTLDNAKLEMNISGSEDDAYLTLLINRASAAIASYVGRALGTQTVKETFRPAWLSNNGSYNLHPHAASGHAIHPLIATFLPINSITSVVVDSGTALVQDTDYEVDTQAGLLWRLSGNCRIQWSGSMTVLNYVSGYVLPQDTGTRTLPWEIENCALALIRAQYYARGQDPSVILEVVEGVGRTQYAPNTISAGMTNDIKTTLAPYRSFVW